MKCIEVHHKIPQDAVLTCLLAVLFLRLPVVMVPVFFRIVLFSPAARRVQVAMEAPPVALPPSWHLHRVFMNSISDDSAYVFQILPLLNSNLLAVSSSDHVIKLYDANLAPVGQLAGHTNTINEVVQSEVDRNFLYSISADSSIRCWDTRTRTQVGQLGGARVGNAEGFCLGHTQHLLAAGMGSSVHLWDLRALGNGVPMRSYAETHTDDVTQAKFRGSTLVTASMDGTVCFWDTTTDDEDSQLLNVIPIDESVSLIGFFGAQLDHLFCLTHSERLSIWNAATIDRLRDFADIREKVSAVTPLDYLVGCHFEPSTQQLLVLGGSFGGDVVVMQVTDAGIVPAFRFAGGHSAVIRSFWWNAAAGVVVTGAEDSRICVWGPNAPATSPTIPSPQRDGKVVRKDKEGKKAAFKPY